jgi:hypothetical protein
MGRRDETAVPYEYGIPAFLSIWIPGRARNDGGAGRFLPGSIFETDFPCRGGWQSARGSCSVHLRDAGDRGTRGDCHRPLRFAQSHTDVADTEQLLRLIQSIPSPKAEPFKLWLAAAGRERIEETIDPELS